MKPPHHPAAALVLALTAAIHAVAAPAAGRDFSHCIDDWQHLAQNRGLPPAIIHETIPSLRYLRQVIENDRRQTEFTRTFAAYLNRLSSAARVDTGREKYRQKKRMLDDLTREYGVPGRYLIALWGVETKFGEIMGDTPALDALATLACDPRRAAYFTAELMTALELVTKENLAPRQMRGSWAGAMGHTQFMPSSWRDHGADGDGDGRVHLIRSEADALASAARFLAAMGWRRGERWGREVSLPRGFPFHLSGYDNKRPLSDWARMGVKDTRGRPLPRLDIPAAIILPSGHHGPAFAVYPNFEVFMKWNNSEHFALTVGILADRIAGAGALTNPPDPNERPLTADQIIAIQKKLNALGYNAGGADGIIGPNTRRALRAYQQSAGLIADGYPDTNTVKQLIAENTHTPGE